MCVSTSTTRRRLRKAGLIGRKPRKKSRLTSRHKKSRMEFARTHKDCTAEQWSQVIGLHSHLISIQSKIFGTRLRQWSRNKIQQVLKNYGLLNSAWEGFPSERLNNLIVSMSRRCAAVIRARGGPTKY